MVGELYPPIGYVSQPTIQRNSLLRESERKSFSCRTFFPPKRGKAIFVYLKYTSWFVFLATFKTFNLFTIMKKLSLFFVSLIINASVSNAHEGALDCSPTRWTRTHLCNG